MSTIKAKIKTIEKEGDLSLLSFVSKSQELTMISLELHPDITQETEVLLRVKATNIAIAKEFSGVLSYANQLKVRIVSIKMGSLLCMLTLDFEERRLESVITATSAKKMQLQINDRVTALIKASDLSIAEIYS